MRYARKLGTTRAAPLVACAAAVGLLAVRLLPDVKKEPLYEDEALAGLVAALPVDDLVATVMHDRGGAPLHFLLGHLALQVHASPTSLRLVSVVFALATVPLCFDLGRRLGGSMAGVAAAFFCATSNMLGVYGSFGRMYALFAFASALAIDLFVRALEQGTPSAIAAAAAAA